MNSLVGYESQIRVGSDQVKNLEEQVKTLGVEKGQVTERLRHYENIEESYRKDFLLIQLRLRETIGQSALSPHNAGIPEIVRDIQAQLQELE